MPLKSPVPAWIRSWQILEITFGDLLATRAVKH